MVETVDTTTYENTYTSAIEVFNILTNPPEQLFCYPSAHDQLPVTWMGDAIGGQLSWGRSWTDNFGGKRRAVSFIGLSGHRYSGTLFETYIRAKRCK